MEMTGLLEIREKLRIFYGKFELYVTAGIKFILGLVVFFMINSQLGYMERLDHPAVVLMLSLGCAFLPVNAMIVLACGMILLHLSALSLEACVIGLCLFLLLFFLYGKFAPKNGYSAVPGAACYAGGSRNVERAFCIFISIVRSCHLLLCKRRAGESCEFHIYRRDGRVCQIYSGFADFNRE